MVKYVPNINSDSIWVKIKKEATGESQDLYLGTVYLSPATKAIKNDSLEDVLEEVSKEKVLYCYKGCLMRTRVITMTF